MTEQVLEAAVVVASNRAAAGIYQDTTGPLIAEALRADGWAVGEPVVVPDGAPVGDAIRAAVEAGARAVVTTGGTGLTPTDRTPEVTRPLLDREVPGIAEAIRAYGVAHGVPTAMLSRGLAGVCGQALVVNLPGSAGGVRDGLAVLLPVLRHAVEQVAGSDHVQHSAGSDHVQHSAGGDHVQHGRGVTIERVLVTGLAGRADPRAVAAATASRLGPQGLAPDA